MYSQSVEGADSGADTRGYDAGTKIHRKNRFIATEIAGLLKQWS